MRTWTTLALAAILAASPLVVGCNGSSPTEPLASVDFTCFNPSSTSLECTATFFSVPQIIEFFWEATGQLAQRGRSIVTAPWDYSRQCATATAAIDAVIRLTLTDERDAVIGPTAHIYPVCLTAAQTTATQVVHGVIDGDVPAARALLRAELSGTAWGDR